MPKVLNVGQCDFDNWQIEQMLKKHFQCQVDNVALHAEASHALGQTDYQLVLVNRINDADGSEGVAFIESTASPSGDGSVPTMMLVSNFEDAQAAAEAVGAIRGFGKNSLEDQATIERLRTVLESE